MLFVVMCVCAKAKTFCANIIVLCLCDCLRTHCDNVFLNTNWGYPGDGHGRQTEHQSGNLAVGCAGAVFARGLSFCETKLDLRNRSTIVRNEKNVCVEDVGEGKGVCVWGWVCECVSGGEDECVGITLLHYSEYRELLCANSSCIQTSVY